MLSCNVLFEEKDFVPRNAFLVEGKQRKRRENYQGPNGEVGEFPLKCIKHCRPNVEVIRLNIHLTARRQVCFHLMNKLQLFMFYFSRALTSSSVGET